MQARIDLTVAATLTRKAGGSGGLGTHYVAILLVLLVAFLVSGYFVVREFARTDRHTRRTHEDVHGSDPSNEA